jgi:hypothetical protein
MDGRTFLKEYIDSLKLIGLWFLTRTSGHNFNLRNKAQVKLRYIKKHVIVPIETGEEGCLNLRGRYLAEVAAGKEVVYVVFDYSASLESAMSFFTSSEPFQKWVDVNAIIFRGVAHLAHHPKAALLLKSIEQNCEPEVSVVFG